MTATTSWVIEWMQTTTAASNPSESVLTAGWRCNGTDTVGSGDAVVVYSATSYGTCSFPQPAEGGAFTPYADLTQSQVLGWCWNNGVDQAVVEAGVLASLDAQINPVVIQPPLPWAPAAA